MYVVIICTKKVEKTIHFQLFKPSHGETYKFHKLNYQRNSPLKLLKRSIATESVQIRTISKATRHDNNTSRLYYTYQENVLKEVLEIEKLLLKNIKKTVTIYFSRSYKIITRIINSLIQIY